MGQLSKLESMQISGYRSLLRAQSPIEIFSVAEESAFTQCARNETQESTLIYY